jgi:hypothetical protein
MEKHVNSGKIEQSDRALTASRHVGSLIDAGNLRRLLSVSRRASRQFAQGRKEATSAARVVQRI